LAEKLNKLQQAMDERKIAFNALTTKNTLIEADLAVARQQHDDLQNALKKMDIDKEESIHRIQRECKREKDVRQNTKIDPNSIHFAVALSLSRN
jgi:predicted  nucleic acid-binding Zn-ribbon protein